MRSRAIMLLVGLAFAVGGCATADPREDLRIEAEVKARLVREKDANLSRLGVLSSNGTVYLSGTVESADQGVRAAQLARDVRGVKRVVNTLDVQAGRPE